MVNSEGIRKNPLAYIIGIINIILHRIEAPNILHTNMLTENLADIQERDRYDVILANPPFGGKKRKEIQQNFPIRTGETALNFPQAFIKILNAGGRAGIVIKNTFKPNMSWKKHITIYSFLSRILLIRIFKFSFHYDLFY